MKHNWIHFEQCGLRTSSSTKFVTAIVGSALNSKLNAKNESFNSQKQSGTYRN